MKTRFFIYEAYKDEEAVLAHKKTPHCRPAWISSKS